MKKILYWVIGGIILFVVLVAITFMILLYSDPVNDKVKDEVIRENDKVVNQLLEQKQLKIDSLVTELDKMKSDLFFCELAIDSLEEQIEFKDRLIEEYKNTIELLNRELAINESIEEDIKNLAKTYETMKVEEMRPIMENIDNETVIAIYRNMNPRKRKDILNALSDKRAAEITKILAGANNREK